MFDELAYRAMFQAVLTPARWREWVAQRIAWCFGHGPLEWVDPLDGVCWEVANAEDDAYDDHDDDRGWVY